jgi:RNA polymerase sigma-70 factor (ECF subfamily)
VTKRQTHFARFYGNFAAGFQSELRIKGVAQPFNIGSDDTLLVEQCRLGRSAAMERLVLKYQDRIYNVILKICANPDDAAELCQEAFVKVLENIDKFEARSSFYTWLFRIAVNLTLNHCQRSARLQTRSLDASDDEHTEDARQMLQDFLSDDSSPDPAAVAQNKELGRMALRALMKLDDVHRTIIVLRDIEGMNYAQIARVLGIELGTVKSRLSRARDNLKDIMENLCNEVESKNRRDAQ